MSEHWKSTPRYWCKHCSTYVRDTQLERQNHESTAKHQGNLKRFLRDLHRGHEREEREKERARQEIARVTGVVTGSSSAASTLRSAGAQHAKSGAPSEAELKRQREQLAELGVAIPSEVRPEMAIPGEWTVTKTRVIKDDADGGDAKKEAAATGVRKRETEEDKEEEAALQGLFKKPRKWGRDSRAMPQEEDSELDALLSGSVLTRPIPSEDTITKREEGEPAQGVKEGIREEEVKEELKKEGDGDDAVKKEPDDEAPQGLAIPVKTEEAPGLDRPVKTEQTDGGGPAPVVFKKRKPKGMLRQK
ncbi:hypothetical protein ACRE_030620 [Hapsidospora chrysogenum ATCC 11550]|uniref:U1-type domain-containing protein n=1 Tax=Hapsidospora chrysogenum (strain ATCC 11550 / CBS 779.69 / DSM 880 / IAM 14645 / JCM 23072 / IMI 49137) TaxID=857340 RepID=A0A086T9M7_HAPC1|nr:hypothetical protein ACRE_030620 [Hapsidospora chrysogenum ATCC 11550]